VRASAQRGACVAIAAVAIALGPGCARAPEPPPARLGAPAPREDGWISASDPAASSPVGAAAPQTPAEVARGKDFADEVRALYRVVACAGSDPVPADLDPRVVIEHCAKLTPKIEGYRRRYLAVAAPFLAALVPPNDGARVVYPFGGGDLVTAITAYPKAREYTTLSLELVGDPRRIRGLPSDALAVSLAKLRSELDELIFVDDYSRSETLKRTQRGEIPGELAFFLVGLAIHDLKPISLRYFRVEADGAARYLTQDDIDATDHDVAERRKRSWMPPDFSEAFANAEIGFVGASDPPSATPRVHRHLAANLANSELSKNPGVLRHLEQKGPVLAMTKAASYLLWSGGFSYVRDYLLDHMTFMVSDSTGIPPSFAARAGFAQETYGTFTRSLLFADQADNAAFRKLWGTSTKRALPFRFGYRDASGHDHLVVTKKP
jgi:hypothetical protein